jgi:imidazolonepropionase-like amidohydrolase
MRVIIRCGQLFTGTATRAIADQTIVIEKGKFTFVGPHRAAPPEALGDVVIDHSAHFVMPGLSDLHIHLSYGNALGQEDIDLYGSPEYRALRALCAAQRVLTGGFTALLDPACSGHVSPALRDAIFCGMFTGPRITAAGPALTSRIGLYDYYPSWIGAPDQSSGVLVKSLTEAIEEIRRQTKDGMDVIKIAMDGIYGDRRRGLYAAFDLDETKAMVREGQRLGRKVVVHARGTEGARYAALAGADIIYHASRIDAEGVKAARDNGCHICPSLALLVNNIQFAQPTDPSAGWWPDIQRTEFATSLASLRHAYDAGVPFVSGSESGFAVTPYGEWETKELEIMTRYLEIEPGEVLRIATSANRKMLRDGEHYDSVAPGKEADFVVLATDPTADLAVLQQPENLIETWLAGKRVEIPRGEGGLPRHPREFAQGMWTQLYTRQSTRGRVLASLAVKGAPVEMSEADFLAGGH